MAQIYTKYLILTVPKLLIIAATAAEIGPLLEHFKAVAKDETFIRFSSHPEISVLISGVGMVNTAYMLGKHLRSDYDIVINAGICGAFNKSLQIGQLVWVVEDTLSEMGAEDGEKFIPYSDLGLGGTNRYTAPGPIKSYSLAQLKQVKGITVNKVHGNENNIRATLQQIDADVESMEGAAFFRACADYDLACLQLRCVSNYVEKRDKSRWNIPLAVKNLNTALIQIINEIQAT
jgi:futalosine hydrolase